MGIFDVLGGGSRRGGGINPLALAVLGTLAYRAVKERGGLGNILGTNPTAPNSTGTPGNPNAANAPAATGGLGGLLGGGALGAGLKDLLDRFRQSGHDAKAQSWVSTGANHDLAPKELEETLGEERLQWLVQQTGMSREQLLAGLSSALPQAVDKLTPEGRLPTDDELTHQLNS